MPRVKKLKQEKMAGGKGRKNIPVKMEYCCKFCLQSFVSFKELRSHRVSCNSAQKEEEDLLTAKDNSIACTKCKKRFKYKSNYQQHLKLEHSVAKGSVQCQECPVRCPNSKALKEHVEKIHERDLFKCPHCPATFVRQFHVVRHLEQKGCGGQVVKDLSCEICNAKFSRRDNMMAHLRQHLVQYTYQCKHCDKAFRSYSKYCRHVQEKHMKNVFECDVCGKSTGSRAAMIKHSEIHGDKKFACNVCGYRTFTIEVMRRHALRHTADKPYKCNICTASFIQMSQLRAHLVRHVSFTCTECNKSFATRVKYMVHQKEHTAGGVMICPKDTCKSMSFTNAVQFKDHLKSHEERPYRCEVCGKQFANEPNMKRHVETHTLERPRRCMYCVSPRAYVRGAMLVRHVRTRHPRVFDDHLRHVRDVMGYENDGRVRQVELDSVLSLLDAVADRILEQNEGEPVLYGGMQEDDGTAPVVTPTAKCEQPTTEGGETPALLSEEALARSLRRLLVHLIDDETLQCLGWPRESVDVVLEKMIEKCGQAPADKERFTRVQRLRENTKHLFLHVVEDKVVSRMLGSFTIDQIVLHILKISGDDLANEDGDNETNGELTNEEDDDPLTNDNDDNDGNIDDETNVGDGDELMSDAVDRKNINIVIENNITNIDHTNDGDDEQLTNDDDNVGDETNAEGNVDYEIYVGDEITGDELMSDPADRKNITIDVENNISNIDVNSKMTSVDVIIDPSSDGVGDEI